VLTLAGNGYFVAALIAARAFLAASRAPLAPLRRRQHTQVSQRA